MRYRVVIYKTLKVDYSFITFVGADAAAADVDCDDDDEDDDHNVTTTNNTTRSLVRDMTMVKRNSLVCIVG